MQPPACPSACPGRATSAWLAPGAAARPDNAARHGSCQPSVSPAGPNKWVPACGGQAGTSDLRRGRGTHGSPTPRAGLATVTCLVLMAAACGSSSPSSSRPGSSSASRGTLIVFGAGTLATPFGADRRRARLRPVDQRVRRRGDHRLLPRDRPVEIYNLFLQSGLTQSASAAVVLLIVTLATFLVLRTLASGRLLAQASRAYA